jgi:hypothetical protein
MDEATAKENDFTMIVILSAAKDPAGAAAPAKGCEFRIGSFARLRMTNDEFRNR